MSPILKLAGLFAVLIASPVAARPFTVDDLLKVEGLGGAYLAPGGRWLVVERTRPYDSATAYDDDVFEPLALSRLDIVDLAHGDGIRPLPAGPAGDGVGPGPISPDGRAMAVFRLQGHRWDLGLADLANAKVRWLGLTVEPANWGRTVQWTSDRTLVAIASADRDAPGRFERLWAAEARPAARWAAEATGRTPTDTVVGSGRFLGLTPREDHTVLVRIDAATGDTAVLARGTFIDLEASPDGRFVAALGDEAPRQPRAGDVLRTGTPEQRRRLTLVELSSGARTRPCGDLEVASHLLAWSPNGDRLLVFAKDDETDWESGRLRVVGAAAGECIAAPTPEVRPAVLYGLEGVPMVRASWMGADPVVLAEAPAGGRRDWLRLTAQGPVNLTAASAAPPPTLLAADTAGVLFADGRGTWRSDRDGRARLIGGGFDRSVSQLGPGDGDRLAYVPARGPDAWVGDGSRIALASASGLTGVQAIPAAASTLVARAHGSVFKVTDAHGVSRLIVQTGGPSQELLQVNAGYAAIDFSKPLSVPFAGAQGETLNAWLYLPTDLLPGAKAPLVVVPYPGSVYPSPPRAYAPGSTFTQVNPYLLTAAGYGVLVASMPRDASSHEPAAGLAAQVLAAVDAAAKAAPIDRGRLALWGHSYGGYAALAIATQTDRFRSVIEAAGKSDLVSAYGPFTPSSRSAPEDGTSPISTMGWMEQGQGGLGVAPAEDVARYARNSPALNAAHISAPVLMIHGDLDFVPLAQGEEMFSALYRLDKDAALVTLWGEGHTATSPANIRRMYGWILWWLDRTLRAGSASALAPPGEPGAPMSDPSLERQELDQARGQVAP